MKRRHLLHPQKYLAMRLVAAEIAAGRMVRLPCEECGLEPGEAHHDDYSRPLDVRFLCFEHHREHHRCAGYEASVLSPGQAAKYLGSTVEDLAAMRGRGTGPEWETGPGGVLYTSTSLLAWEKISAVPEGAVTTVEAARIIGVSVGTLRNLNHSGTGPTPAGKAGVRVLYNRSDLAE